MKAAQTYHINHTVLSIRDGCSHWLSEYVVLLPTLTLPKLKYNVEVDKWRWWLQWEFGSMRDSLSSCPSKDFCVVHITVSFQAIFGHDRWFANPHSRILSLSVSWNVRKSIAASTTDTRLFARGYDCIFLASIASVLSSSLVISNAHRPIERLRDTFRLFSKPEKEISRVCS
jgi:hypothetical protein